MIFEHTIHENSPQLISVLAVKVTRAKAYRGPLLKNESYTFILDSGDWVMNYLPINNALLAPEFKCSSQRLEVFDPNYVPPEPMKNKKLRKLFFSIKDGQQDDQIRGRPNQEDDQINGSLTG